MCEILFSKHNPIDLRFSEADIESSLLCNDDGMGYVVLEKEKSNRWNMIETFKVSLLDIKDKLLEGNKEDVKIEFEAEKSEIEETKQENQTIGKLLTIKTDFAQKKLADEKALQKWIKEGSAEYYDDYDDHGYNYKSGTYKSWKKPKYETFEEKVLKEAKDRTDIAMDMVHSEMIDKFYTRQENLTDNQLIIMHFRIATSGKSGDESTQPVVTPNYTMIHNGILSGMGNATKSDTLEFCELIDEQISKISRRKLTPTIEKRIITTEINKLTGSYSMFIYSHLTKKLYYYKNTIASFTWYNKQKTLGATKHLRFPNSYINGESVIID